MPDEVHPKETTGQQCSRGWNELAWVWPFLARYRGRLFAAALLSIAAGAGGLAFPWLIGAMVDGISAPTSAPMPRHTLLNANTAALLLLAVLSLQAACIYLHVMWFAEAAECALVDMRKDVYSRLLCLPMTFFGERRIGELSSRLTSDFAQLEKLLTDWAPRFLRQATVCTGGVVLLIVTSWKLSILMIAVYPALAVLAVTLGRRIRSTHRTAQDRLAESAVVVEETLQGIATVKAFANEEFETQRYGSALERFLESVLRGARFRGAFVAFVLLALAGTMVWLLWYGVQLVQRGELSGGDLTRFVLYMVFVGGAIGVIADDYGTLQKAIGATQRVRELLEEKPEILLGEPAIKRSAVSRLRGDVAFEDVHFRYPSRPDAPVLIGFSLSTRSGERVALVGPSGAGKSTVVALLLCFYRPESGAILIDGRKAEEYSLIDLRRQIGIVPQEVILFGGTIAENIAYGKPGASRDEIVEAARQANADQFIAQLPHGYETIVGERGTQLSGGQRQRVAIARAVLKDPAILVLDEATSSLDSESERMVQSALEKLMVRRTTFIIAHRLSTIRSADRIVILDRGRVVETGTHDELLRNEDGLYRNLSRLQFDLQL